jgi:hypothetical protein
VVDEKNDECVIIEGSYIPPADRVNALDIIYDKKENSELIGLHYQEETEIFYFSFKYKAHTDSFAFNKHQMLTAIFDFTNQYLPEHAKDFIRQKHS